MLDNRPDRLPGAREEIAITLEHVTVSYGRVENPKQVAVRDVSLEFPKNQIDVEDDHIPYLKANIPSVDLIDFDYPCWHMACDTLDQVSAHSLKIVGDVVYASLPEIDRH